MKKSVSITITILILAAGSIALPGQAQPTTEKLASGTYIVAAVAPQVWRFAVDPKTMRNATVSGHFAVTDGVPKNIDVFVFNQENFTKWRSDDDAAKASAKPLFSLIKKTEGDVNVRLSEPDMYYLVLSNLFAYEGRKTLNADIKLQYEKQ